MAIRLLDAYLCSDCDLILEGNSPCPKCLNGNTLALAPVLNRPSSEEWPESEEFYNLMQYYRHFPLADQKGTRDAYEAVKEWLRRHRERL